MVQTSLEDNQGSQEKDTEVGTGREKDYSRIKDQIYGCGEAASWRERRTRVDEMEAVDY